MLRERLFARRVLRRGAGRWCYDCGCGGTLDAVLTGIVKQSETGEVLTVFWMKR